MTFNKFIDPSPQKAFFGSTFRRDLIEIKLKVYILNHNNTYLNTSPFKYIEKGFLMIKIKPQIKVIMINT